MDDCGLEAEGEGNEAEGEGREVEEESQEECKSVGRGGELGGVTSRTVLVSCGTYLLTKSSRESAFSLINLFKVTKLLLSIE